jgi:hypothetical protein
MPVGAGICMCALATVCLSRPCHLGLPRQLALLVKSGVHSMVGVLWPQQLNLVTQTLAEPFCMLNMSSTAHACAWDDSLLQPIFKHCSMYGILCYKLNAIVHVYAGKASDRRKAVSRASKAGLQFPVGRLAR